LLLRIKALEDKLASMSGHGLPDDAITKCRPSLRPLRPIPLTHDKPEDDMIESESQGSTSTQNVYAAATQVVPQEITVDELATSAFEEQPRSNVQFFGKVESTESKFQ
jgi:hypothetical protein